MKGFHVSDGIHFKREDNGSVSVSNEKGLIIKIDRDSWASVIAEMSFWQDKGLAHSIAEVIHTGRNN